MPHGHRCVANMEEFDEATVERTRWLIENGGFKTFGVDENGEEVLTPDMDVLEEIAPDIYELYMQKIMQEIAEYVDLGYVFYEWDEEEQDFLFGVTEEGQKYFDDNGISWG